MGRTDSSEVAGHGATSSGAGEGRLARLLDWLSWRRIIAVAFMCGLGFGGAAYIFVPAHYSANTTVLTNDRLPSLDASATLSALGLGQATATVTRMENILQSRRVREAISEKHSLPSHFGCTSAKALEKLGQMTTVKVLGRSGLSGVGLKVEVACPGPSRAQQWLGRRTPLTASQARQLCAELANEYVAGLDDYLTESGIQYARATANFIEKRLSDVEAGLAQTEDQLEDLQTEHGLIEPSARAGDLSAVARQVVLEAAIAAREITALERSIGVCRSRLSGEDVRRVSEETVARNPLIVSLEQRRSTLQSERATLLAEGKQSAHPDVVAVDAALAEIDKEFRTATDEVLQSVSRQPNPLHDNLLKDLADMEMRLAGARARDALLQAQLDDAEDDLRQLPPVVREYEELSRRRVLQAELLTTLARQLEMANIESQKESSISFAVLDEAVPPERSSGTSATKAFLLSFIAVTSLLGLAWAYRHGLFADYCTAVPQSDEGTPAASSS